MKIRMAVAPPLAALGEDAFPGWLDTCESLGFDTVWLSDLPVGPLGDPLVSLSFAAARTQRLKLGANLVPLGRHPLLLARQLAQLDRLSGGRLLLSFVPGLGAPAERAALGHASGNRGTAIDEMTALMRRWWSGETVTATWRDLAFEAIALEPRPLQSPLEIWLGGIAPAALERVARMADGWLTSAATPAEAGRARRRIAARARELGRAVDEEHYGISVPYAREAPDEAALAPLRARRADRDLTDVVTTGAGPLRALLERHVDEGLSKFVLRPLGALDPGVNWRSDLDWLAETVLPLQT